MSYSDCGFCKRMPYNGSAFRAIAESSKKGMLMLRVNGNIYAEMIVKMRKLWFSFWW